MNVNDDFSKLFLQEIKQWQEEIDYYFLGKHIFGLYNIFYSNIEISGEKRLYVGDYPIIDGIKITNPNMIVHFIQGYENENENLRIFCLEIKLFDNYNRPLFSNCLRILNLEKFLQVFLNNWLKDYECLNFDDFCQEFVKFSVNFLIKNSEKLFSFELYNDILEILVYEN